MRTTSLGVVHDVWAFFADDRRPLAETEVEEALRILSYSRADLLALVPAALTEEPRKILLHVGSAQWWYLDRLGMAFPKAELSDDVLNQLDQVRSVSRQVLPALVGTDEIVERDLAVEAPQVRDASCGETWSPRKFVGRVLWHERDHTQQLVSVLG